MVEKNEQTESTEFLATIEIAIGICENCLFFKQTEDLTEHTDRVWIQGDCRRHAPIASLKSDDRWPTVQNDDWCGDFEFNEDME